MSLVDWQIKQAIKNKELIIDPYDESLVNPDSLDIRLGNILGRVIATGEAYYSEWIEDLDLINDGYEKKYSIIDPTNKKSFNTEYFNIENSNYILKPGECILASMLENITLSSNLIAHVIGKSSIGRLGLINSAHAGLVDGGWAGILTMELSNASHVPILLTYKMKIGQLIFEITEEPEKSYEETGRYQRQKPGQGSLGL